MAYFKQRWASPVVWNLHLWTSTFGISCLFVLSNEGYWFFVLFFFRRDSLSCTLKPDAKGNRFKASMSRKRSINKKVCSGPIRDSFSWPWDEKGKHKGPPTVTPLSQAPPGELFSSICFPGDIRTVNSRCAHEQLLCTWAKSGHADLVDCLVVLCYIFLSLHCIDNGWPVADGQPPFWTFCTIPLTVTVILILCGQNLLWT